MNVAPAALVTCLINVAPVALAEAGKSNGNRNEKSETQKLPQDKKQKSPHGRMPRLRRWLTRQSIRNQKSEIRISAPLLRAANWR
jgi:hypothetical protein